MWYRLISHHAPVDTELAEQITGALAAMLRPDAEAAAPSTADAVTEAAGVAPTAERSGAG